jgi:hypothetical protein
MNNKSNMPAKLGQWQRLHLNEGELSKICAERGEGKSLLRANMDRQLVYEDFEIDNDYLILYAE